MFGNISINFTEILCFLFKSVCSDDLFFGIFQVKIFVNEIWQQTFIYKKHSFPLKDKW